jgi:hypothetical protein
MKKYIISFSIVCICIVTLNAKAQRGTGARLTKEFVRKELSPATGKADSVFAVYDTFSKKLAQWNTSGTSAMSNDERNLKVDKARAEKDEALKLLLTDQQIKRFEDYSTNLRKNKVVW